MKGRATRSAPASPRADLHLHSLGSDGLLSPEEVARACVEGGLDLIALTDHDLPPSLPAGSFRHGGRELRVVHGAELTARHRGVEVHLLVYFPGEMPEEFRSFLTIRASARADRYEALRERLGCPGLPAADELARSGGRALTRQHLARAIVAAGHARTHAEAWSRFLNAPEARVEPVGLELEEALERVRSSGGLSSWAHPDLEQARAWAGELALAGLDAIEACRPRLTQDARAGLQRVALRNRLLVTGGSDWHGWEGRPLGAFSFPWREALPFAQALGIG